MNVGIKGCEGERESGSEIYYLGKMMYQNESIDLGNEENDWVHVPAYLYF